MENIKLIVNGQSVGAIFVDSDKIIRDIFIHKTTPKDLADKISKDDLLGTQVNCENYYVIEV